MLQSEFSVVVIGAGSTGIGLAEKLSAQRIKTAVIDQFPIASYSSTRNQGWLQGGAYYASINDPGTAVACQAGTRAISEFCPEAVHHDIPSHFLFSSENDLDGAVARCRDLEIAADPLTRAEMDQLIGENPLLKASPLRFAMRTRDRPTNTHFLLGRLSAKAAAQGAHFIPVPHLHVLDVRPADRGWEVVLDDGQVLQTKNIVAAAGPYLHHLVREIRPRKASKLKVTKVGVCVMTSERPLSSSLLATPGMRHGPNVVPFRSDLGRGVSICLGGTDQDCDEERDYLDDEIPEDLAAMFERGLNFSLPALRSLAAADEIGAHFYMCQKIKAQTRERIIDPWVERLTDQESRRFLAVYPGKFTAAPIVTDEVMAIIDGWDVPRGETLMPTTPPPVARQKYYLDPEYDFTGAGTFEMRAR